MKIHEKMLSCNGCEYLKAGEGDYYLNCYNGNHWVEGVPENPPCFRIDPFVLIDNEAILVTEGE